MDIASYVSLLLLMSHDTCICGANSDCLAQRPGPRGPMINTQPSTRAASPPYHLSNCVRGER